MASNKYHQLDHHQCKIRPIVYKDHGSSKLRLSRYQSFQKINLITMNIIIFSVVISVIEANVPHSNPPNEDNTFATSGPELDSNSGTIGSDNDSGGSIPSVATYRPRANNPEWNSTGNSEHFDVPTYGSSPVGSHSSTGHSSTGNGDETVTEVKDLRYAVASFDFHHVATPYIISLWIIIVGLAKIGFHVTPKLSSICPESVVLMILGVLIGILLFYGGIDKPGSVSSIIPPGQSPESLQPTFQQPLTPNIFFLYMLPPIVMDAGYHMPNRLFFDNLCSILLYAVLGTIWNALTIGLCLYACASTGLFGVELPLLDTLLFSSIVSAVDPVAVLAVFEEIHVNEVLYILVFGESLLNDAVTVVLYHMFEGYTEMGKENILAIDYIAGFTSFFVIALGGTFMGVIWGFAAAFVSRFTHHVKIIEPIFVFVMAYLSYLSAEMFHLSGILALTFCGITMKNYVEENITETSQTTLKYAMKMLANSSESVIFLFLGVCTVTDTHDWNTMFVILTIVFALVFRALGVVIFTSIANRFRLHKLTGIEQFIMSYGGLRGAVAFALVLVVNEHIIPTKKMMVTTIIAIVYFTVFLQGMTIGPLVKILKVPRANKFEMSMNERIHNRLMDHTMAGIEDISGMMIGNYKIRDKFRHLNNQFLKHWFLRDSHERGNSSRKIFETYSRLNLQDAINIVNNQSNKNSPNNIYNNNNTNDKTLSQLFRTFTETNLSTGGGDQTSGVGDRSGTFTSLCLETPSSVPTFNFDLANLDYSPSHRDMAEAEIHHILSDNLFKPVRRFRKYSKCDLPESSENHPGTFQHMARVNMRTIMSQNLKKRQRLKQQKSRSDLKSSGGSLTASGHSNHHSSSHGANYLSPDRALNDARLSVPNGGVRARSEPPTGRTHLTQLTENDGETDAGIVFTVNRGKNDHPGSEHRFPILDINSGGITREERSVSDVHKRVALQDAGHDNDGYTSVEEYGHGFVSAESPYLTTGRKSPSHVLGGRKSPSGVSNPVYEVDEDDAPKTSAESTLPWRRDSSTNPPDSDMARGQEVADYDRSSVALKQEEFPPWITNKDYIPNYASPTDTLLAEIDRKNSMQKTPSVYEIFTIADSPDAATSGKVTNRSSSHSPSHDVQETDSHSLSKTDNRGNRVRAQDKEQTKGVAQDKEQTKGVTGDRAQNLGRTSGGNKTMDKPSGDRESTSVTISIGHPQTTINLGQTDTSRL